MRTIKLRRGLDLKLKGELKDSTALPVIPQCVAVTPDDFPGFSPKAIVNPGDKVLPGQPLLYDKLHPSVKLVSPVKGEVEAVVRGARRKIERVVVKVDQQQSDFELKLDTANALSSDAALRELMQQTGLWACMRQRPYDIVPADTDLRPRDIFVTTFDSAPLAPSLMEEVDVRFLETGVKALASLTDGKVYIGTMPGGPTQIDGAEIVQFKGKFPVSNAGVQASHIAPVNKGDVIWTLDVITVCRLGQLLSTGSLPMVTRVAVVGPEVEKPAMLLSPIGSEIAPMLKGRERNDNVHHRIISGNVLTGYRVEPDGFLRFPYRQITVIAEGDDVDEFMGWASVGISKMSQSPTFLSTLLPGRRFSPDARLNGGRRAMILSGEYDKTFPMDILPEQLIKAIMAHDIDRMEQLGIYEVAPEDFAAAEYVDASKLELQKIVRDGLDYLRKELE